jgi:hypothetical protein
LEETPNRYLSLLPLPLATRPHLSAEPVVPYLWLKSPEETPRQEIFSPL